MAIVWILSIGLGLPGRIGVVVVVAGLVLAAVAVAFVFV